MPDSSLHSPAPHTRRTAGGTTVVTLSGEMDLATTVCLRTHLDALTAAPRPDLVLDLRPVPFVDCAGLGLLCRVRSRVAARGGRLRLVTGSAAFRRLLRHAGLSGVFEVLPDPAAVRIAAPVPPQRPMVPTGQG
ncbi:STAS domain-containing protein [Streptomyces sp. NPDC096152]|uniref:STAS domain-containing protein n=1 Tax=Streptomyces sp. NPDC096152 TaxID=3366078 RepID=UPI00380CE8DB